MRRIVTVTLSLLGICTANAQYATYNHDATKMNQITVMETGAGSLTPELYYTLLHNTYKKSASAKNKLGYRTETGAFGYMQVEMAEKIDTALTKRAEIEALNIADRKIDIAWNTEGKKIEAKMEAFQENINRIVPAGGSPSDRKRWQEYYNLYQTAIRATKDAYLPNAQRKKQYLRIYADVSRQNDLLIRYIVSVSNRAHTAMALNAKLNRTDRTATIVREAQDRWRGSTSDNSITE